MEQPEGTDEQVRRIVEDGDDRVLCILGRAFLANRETAPGKKKAVMVLTDRNLYQVGTFYDPDGKGGYSKNEGRNVVALDALRGANITEVPVNPWISRIGAALLAIGLALLLWGIIDGSVFGMVVGLFVGAVWMMVPGALMLFYARSDGQKFLGICHRGGTFAVSCRSYPTPELAAFQEKLAAAIAE